MAEQLIFSGDRDRALLSRQLKDNKIRRLATGIYTEDLKSPAEDIVRQNAWAILGHFFPKAVIVDRSAINGASLVNGYLYVAHTRERPLKLPGLEIIPRQSVGAVEGDVEWPSDTYFSSEARALLDNAATSRPVGGREPRTLTQLELETWIDRLASQRGEEAMRAIRHQARALAPLLKREKEFARIDALIGAALGSRKVNAESTALQARQAGVPYDSHRVTLFNQLAEYLRQQAPRPLTATHDTQLRRKYLPFFEAYFSNFIEGTQFTVDEASEIVFDETVPNNRPVDAHDVSATYAIVADTEEISHTPSDPTSLYELLRSRHARLMAERPDKHPGEFKTIANQAGSTLFVAPELVHGTLAEGWRAMEQVLDPFARAVMMMFVISEVHPFDDGNGRIARIMMNAELVATNEQRIIVPIVYRNNYLSGLRAMTHGGNAGALTSVLDFARRYTARIDFATMDSAQFDLQRTNAFMDANEAEENGIRLLLP